MQPARPALILCILIFAGFSLAGAPATQPTAQPATQPATSQQDDFLGPRFLTRAGGISFRPPRGGVQIKPANVGVNIVQYVNTEEKWSLNVTRMVLEKPLPLVSVDDPATPTVNEAREKPGLIDQTARQLVIQSAATRILRQDQINVGQNDAGIIISRFSQGGQAYLRQMLLLRVTDQLYYVFDLTTPSTRTPDDKEDVEDPSEALAVRIFDAMVDTIYLVDQRAIIADRDDRLYRTRTLMVNLPRALRQAVVPEQYFRIIRDGRDIGWTFVAEELGERRGQNGVFVATLSQTSPQAGTTIDIASEMFAAQDQRGEAWVTITVADKDGQKDHVSEFGQTDLRIRRVVDKEDDPLEARRPNITRTEVRMLTVTQSGKAGGKTITRELPPFYFTQAFGQLLPRLLPRDAKGYLFLVWVSSEQELVYRYMDVEPQRKVTFGGKTVAAIPIRDRIGLEGEPTYHYLGLDGRYLGSENRSTGLVLLATDQKTISGLWPNAKIARPHVLDTPMDR